MKSGIAFLLAVLIALPSIPATAYQADDTLYNEATMKKDKTSIHVDLKDIGIIVNCDITRKTLASTYGGSDSEVPFCLDCRKASKDKSELV